MERLCLNNTIQGGKQTKKGGLKMKKEKESLSGKNATEERIEPLIIWLEKK